MYLKGEETALIKEEGIKNVMIRRDERIKLKRVLLRLNVTEEE